MTQEQLFHEDIYEALRHVVAALGGAKKVGATMRPEKTIDQARTWLNNCLDTSRAEKLDLDEFLYLLRMARQEGVHSAMSFIADDAGYSVEPLNVDVELEEGRQQITALLEQQQRIMTRMERLTATQMRER